MNNQEEKAVLHAALMAFRQLLKSDDENEARAAASELVKALHRLSEMK